MSEIKTEKSMKTNIFRISSQDNRDVELESGPLFEEENDCHVFVEKEEGPNFRGVSCLGGAVLIAKTQLGLGVLGLPLTFAILGFVPGLISLLALCALSTWSGALVGTFCLSHPQVHSIGDAVHLMFGKHAREVVGTLFWLYYIILYASALLSLSIAFNTVTEHAACTLSWTGMCAGIVLIVGIPLRTMKILTIGGSVAVISISIAVWVVAIACLTQSTPVAALSTDGTVHKIIRVAGSGSSYTAISGAVATQLLSLSGTPAFFSIHAEMRDQSKYLKSLLIAQGFVVSMYIIISCMIYAKVGQYIASPSLGSAGKLFQKIGYGIAFPGLFFSTYWFAHLSAKYALVRVLRGTKHLQSNTWVHWLTWSGLMILGIGIGFVIAGAVPFFDDLISLVGSLFGSLLALVIPLLMALYELGKDLYVPNESFVSWIKKSQKNWRGKRAMVFFSLMMLTSGVYICVTGTYGAIASIAQGYADGRVPSAFYCGDNSGL